jgi:hypothetical protein
MKRRESIPTLNETHAFVPEPLTGIDKAIFDLGVIAGQWRDTQEGQCIDAYRDLYEALRKMGWQGSLDIEQELPNRFMPEDYLNRFNLKRDDE